MNDIKFNFKFIDLIEKNNCIYNYSTKDYTNRDKVESTWKTIAKEMGATVGDCKERWKHIRGSFTRHLKNQYQNARSDAKRCKKSYYLADRLQFLLPFTKTRKSSENIQYPENADSEDSIQGEETMLETPAGEITEQQNDMEDDLDRKPYELVHKVAKPRNTDNELSMLDVDEGYLDYHRQNWRYSEHDIADLDFFKSLLPDIRIMTLEQKRRLKIGILTQIGDILSEKQSTPLPYPTCVYSEETP